MTEHVTVPIVLEIHYNILFAELGKHVGHRATITESLDGLSVHCDKCGALFTLGVPYPQHSTAGECAD